MLITESSFLSVTYKMAASQTEVYTCQYPAFTTSRRPISSLFTVSSTLCCLLFSFTRCLAVFYTPNCIHHALLSNGKNIQGLPAGMWDRQDPGTTPRSGSPRGIPGLPAGLWDRQDPGTTPRSWESQGLSRDSSPLIGTWDSPMRNSTSVGKLGHECVSLPF